MDIQDVVVGETYRFDKDLTFRVSGKGNSRVVVGYWNDRPDREGTVWAESLSPIVKRWEIISYGLPKIGDWYVNDNFEKVVSKDEFVVVKSDKNFTAVYCLIVKEIKD